MALRRVGIEAEIFEQAPELREEGAGIQLGPNVVRLLGRLGLGERLREVAVRPEVVWEYRRREDGRVLFQQRFGNEHRSVFGAPYYVVHRADLLHVLREAVPDAAVHLGRRCVGVAQDGGVELAFEDGSRARSDVLVGADGIRSTVRDTVLPPSPPASPAFAATAVSSRSSAPRRWRGGRW